jgi:hypothetical protein
MSNVNFQTTNPAQANDRLTELQVALALDEANLLAFNSYAAAGALTPGGNAILKTGTAGAFTLAAPIAGSQLSGGQDGCEMTIVSGDAHAYTVTTPASALNGSLHVATWTAAIGNSMTLLAYNGVWYTSAALNGVALT